MATKHVAERPRRRRFPTATRTVPMEPGRSLIIGGGDPEAAIALLESWRHGDEADLKDQRETWALLEEAMRNGTLRMRI